MRHNVAFVVRPLRQYKGMWRTAALINYVEIAAEEKVCCIFQGDHN
jgi:hypothetical protein